MRWQARSAAVLAVVLCLAALTSCAAVPSPVPLATATALPEGVTIELRQARSDVAARQASVRVINAGDRVVRIGGVSVVDPRFAEPAVRVVDRVSTVRPGGAVDVHLQLGPVACAEGVEPDGERAVVTLHYERDGVATVARVPVTDPVPFVAALHYRECLQERVFQQATLSLGDFMPSPAEEPADLLLRIDLPARPYASEGASLRVRLVGIRETNLLTFAGLRDGGVLPIERDLDGSGATAVALPLLPARCDPHAVLEDKRGTVFRVLVEVDGEAGSFDLAASEALRGRLLEWVATWCGFGAE